MSNEEIQKEIDGLKARTAFLEKIAIQLNLDPQTALYLSSFLFSSISGGAIPTSTYSASSPSGTPATGSVWYKDTGVLATREIHVYSGSAWIQFK